MTDPARVFVDANVFLRFFTVDNAGQAARAEHVFRRAAAGELALVTGQAEEIQRRGARAFRPACYGSMTSTS